MADYRALASALERPEFAGLSDAEAAAAIEAAVESVEGVIPARAVKRLWGQRMVLAAAKMASENPEVPMPLRVLCLATYDNLMGDLFADLDPRDPTQAATIKQFLDGLEAAGVLSAEVRAETMALAVTEVPMLDRIGWGVLREMDDKSAESAVAAARKLGA